MKKLFILLAVLFSFGTGGTALVAQQMTLSSVCEGLSKHPNTTGDFTQIKTINANGRQLKSTGKFIISNQGIMWKTQKPFPSSIVITKDKMIQTAADGKQTVMSGSDNQIFKNISDCLSSVFAGNSEDLEKNFITDFTDNGDGSWSLILTPKDATISSVMQQLQMKGTVSSSLVKMDSLEMSETSSNKIKYEFSNQEYPKELTDDEKTNFSVN